jgi:hypothetical protein
VNAPPDLVASLSRSSGVPQPAVRAVLAALTLSSIAKLIATMGKIVA